jgi:hypothetical protein
MLSAGHKAIAIPSATLLTKKDKELLSMLHSAQPPGSSKNCPQEWSMVNGPLGQRPLATGGTQEWSMVNGQ